MLAQGIPTQFALSLVPNATEYSWIPYAPNLTGSSSKILVGQYDTSQFIPTNAVTLNITSVKPNSWVFNVTMGIGLTNTTNGIANATQFYYNLTNTTYNQALITTAYPGVGLGVQQYQLMATWLNNMTGGTNLWTCIQSRGGYCTAPVWCETFNGD